MIGPPTPEDGDIFDSTAMDRATDPFSPIPDAPQRYDNFGSRVDAVKWEVGGFVAALTLINLPLVIRDPQPFKFQSEGWFGTDTPDAGVDKLAHAWNTYVFSDILYRRMARKTGGGPASARTAAVLGLGLQTYGELFDAVHEGSGFSLEDIAFNTAGAGFQIMRNSVPGMAEKVDFRLLIMPNQDVITFRGKEHFEQQWFQFAVKGSGFDELRETPFRFLEFHVGYHAENFTAADRRSGNGPKRKPFVGIGLNISELLLKRQRGTAAGIGRAALTYLQIPYTAVHVD